MAYFFSTYQVLKRLSCLCCFCNCFGRSASSCDEEPNLPGPISLESRLGPLYRRTISSSNGNGDGNGKVSDEIGRHSSILQSTPSLMDRLSTGYSDDVSRVTYPHIPETFFVSSYPHAAKNYWRYVSENDISIGMQLCTKGIPYHLVQGQKFDTGNYIVDFINAEVVQTSSETTTENGYKRTLYQITNKHSLESRIFVHYFIDWPDQGIPLQDAFIAMMRDYDRAVQDLGRCNVFVHCRAGIGRSGTFILARVMSKASEKTEFQLRRVLKTLRSQRFLVETLEQEQFALACSKIAALGSCEVQEAARSHLSVIISRVGSCILMGQSDLSNVDGSNNAHLLDAAASKNCAEADLYPLVHPEEENREL